MNDESSTGNGERGTGNPIIILIWLIFLFIFLSDKYISPDGVGYFSYLPSLLFDHDLFFENEFRDLRLLAPLALTETSYIHNHWPIGPALLWAPFYLVGRLLFCPDTLPYNRWVVLWVNGGSMFFGLLCFFLLTRLQKAALDSHPATIGALAFFGTPMFFYTFLQPNHCHALSAFLSTLFFWYWLASTKNHDSRRRYMILGLILGLIFMTRHQDVLFGAAVLVELAARRFKNKQPAAAIHAPLLLFGACFLIGASPQLIVWQIVNGSLFAAPSHFNLSLEYFSLSGVLFSPFHGLLFWTPIYFLGLAGVVIGCFQKPLIYTGLLIAFVGQLLVNSAIVAFWEGHSFGLRQMTSTLPVVVLGLSQLTISIKGKNAFLESLVWLAIALSGLWTTGLLLNALTGLTLSNYLSITEIFSAQVDLLFNLHRVIDTVAYAGLSPLSKTIPLALFCLTLLAVLAYLKRLHHKPLEIAALILVFCYIATSNGIILNAATNKPEVDQHNPDYVTVEQYNRFFIDQAETVRGQLPE